MATEILEFLGEETRPAFELPGVFLSALVYYCWVVDVVSQVLPYLAEEIGIDDEWVAQMNSLQNRVIREAQHQFDH